jgi:GNAT superfamily N-acetyltransferase
VQIRETTLDDIADIDRIRRAVFPWWVSTVAAQRNMFKYNPPAARYLRLVAEVDGHLAAFAWSGINTSTAEEGVGSGTVTVDPAYRGRGIAKALYDRIDAHLHEIGARRAQAFALDDPPTIAWAQRQGWKKGASARFSMVDPHDLPPVPAVPEGVELVSLATLTPDQAFGLDSAMSDEPGDVAMDNWTFDEWKHRIWDNPDLNRDMSTIALVDGEPACFTNVEANLESGRCWSGGTGTDQRFRGRGLAKLVKSVALRKAAEGGITAALTANDYSNAPMLAINNWLGYKVIASEYSMLKDFR